MCEMPKWLNERLNGMVILKVNDTNNQQFAKAVGCFSVARFAPLKLKDRFWGCDSKT